MKPSLKFLALASAAACFTSALPAADAAPAASATAEAPAAAASPTGLWKWTQKGRDGASWEQSLKLNYADGKLTGALLAAEAPWGQTPETEISDGSFKDGVASFSVHREFNGNTFVIKYAGKLSGDTLTGTVERPGRDGGAPQKRDWTATRGK